MEEEENGSGDRKSRVVHQRREYVVALLLLGAYCLALLCFGVALYWWIANDSEHWVLGTGMFGFGVVIAGTAAATTALEWAQRQPKYALKHRLLQVIEMNVLICSLVPMLAVISFTAVLQVLSDNEETEGDIGWSTVAVAAVASGMTLFFAGIAIYYARKSFLTYTNTSREGKKLLALQDSDEDSDLGFTDLISTSLPAHSTGGAVQAFM